MAKSMQQVAIADELIMNQIYIIRNQKIMLDRDLADLYGVETKVLKQAVRRNINRFPGDFMFEMNNEEFDNWRSQFTASNSSDKMGLRHAPFCFTEQGVTMLSCVLNSDRAIIVNIQIIRIFIKMREAIFANKDILLKLEELERKVTDHDTNIKTIFQYLKQQLNPPAKPRAKIGFKDYD